MDEMLKAVSRFPNGTYLKIEWADARLSLGGILDTVYQTDNGKPENTVSFREYYAFAFRIKQVLRNMSGTPYTVNSLMEISMEAPPTGIMLESGEVVWQRFGEVLGPEDISAP